MSAFRCETFLSLRCHKNLQSAVGATPPSQTTHTWTKMKINKINIREYALSDKNPVLNLMRLNTPEYFSMEEEKEFDHYLDYEIEEYFVITVDDKIVGCGGINYEDDNSTGIISWDMVHPEYQGRSLGSKILKHRIGILKKQKNIAQIIVRTSQLTNVYYEKHGFKLLEIVENYWADGYHLYKMEYSK